MSLDVPLANRLAILRVSPRKRRATACWEFDKLPLPRTLCELDWHERLGRSMDGRIFSSMSTK